MLISNGSKILEHQITCKSDGRTFDHCTSLDMAKKQGNNVAKAPTGDDLDDDLDVDPAFLGSPVASGSGSSLHEDQAIGEIDDSVDDEAFFSDEDDGETKSKASVKHAGVKRKADAEEDEATKAAEKKRRKKEREKRRKARVSVRTGSRVVLDALAHCALREIRLSRHLRSRSPSRISP